MRICQVSNNNNIQTNKIRIKAISLILYIFKWNWLFGYWIFLPPDFLMDSQNMFLQTSLFCKLMIAQLTRMFDFLMDRLNMFLQTSFFCKLIITQITRISQSHMWSLNVLFEFTICLEVSFANFTKYFWHWAQFYVFSELHPFVIWIL